MLQAIRERVTGIVAIFVLGLLAVPFLFFGLDSYLRGTPQNAIASVGDTEITISEFETSFARYKQRMRQQMGDNYNEIEFSRPEVRREHLETMIDEILLRRYAESAGLGVSEQAVLEVLGGISAFQIEGQFNPDVYRRALRSAGETPASFESDLRQDLQTRVVPTALAESSVVTETEVDRLISLQRQKRRVAVVDVPADRFADEVSITEQDVATYYEENPDEFMAEEQVRLDYVELDTGEMLQDATLDEDELRQRYEAAKQRYLTPEARNASHILISANEQRSKEEARALVEQLRERIDQGESFEEIAREYSDDFASADQGGDLGFVEPGDMVSAFEDALYDLESVGDVSEPVETQFGWHLIRLDGLRPPQGMSFAEARSEILEEYRARQREDLYIELSQRMVDLVYANDATLEPLAEELDLEIRQTEWFTRDGADEGIASRPEVVDAAFSDLVLRDGAVSDPIELENNRMVAIKVAEHRPAEPRPLDEVADRIRETLRAERTAEMAQARAQELLDQVSSEGGSLEQVAEQAGLEIENIDALQRNEFRRGPAFVQEVFALPDPGQDPTLHVLPRRGGYAVVRLEAVIAGDPTEASESERDMIRRQLTFLRTTEAVEGLIARLRADTDISVDENRL